MSKKKNKIEILSFTFLKDGKTHVATPANVEPKEKTNVEKKRLVVKKSAELNVKSTGACNCGETKCVNGKVWQCMPLDDEGNCIWFITSESC